MAVQQQSEPTPAKPCNVCTDFQTLRKKNFKSNSKAAAIPSSSTSTFATQHSSTPSALASNALASASVKQETTMMECPPDSGELGRSTWTFLHTMAAYYPETPSKKEENVMLGLIEGLSLFYPCDYCADHLRKEVKRRPPKVSSNIELSDWFCQIHNEVNVRQGKPEFDCSKVFERWRSGNRSNSPSCFGIAPKGDKD